MSQEDEAWRSKIKKRSFLLVPFNLIMMKLTLDYARNIKGIAKKYWPGRQRFTVGNFLLVGTLQAVIFSSVYFGGTCAIMGVNPIKTYADFK
jgi:hypothetical protein